METECVPLGEGQTLERMDLGEEEEPQWVLSGSAAPGNP